MPAPLELGAAEPWRNLEVIRSKQLYNHSLLISNLLRGQMETLCVCGNPVRVHLIIISWAFCFNPEDTTVRHGAGAGKNEIQNSVYPGRVPVSGSHHVMVPKTVGGCEEVTSFPMWCLC